MVDYFQILCGALVLLLAFYYYLTSSFNYWKKLGVAGPRPLLIFGNLKSTTLAQASMSDTTRKMYNEFKNEPVFGIYGGSAPILIVNDLDLVKDVLIGDFSLFASRGLPLFPKLHYLTF